MGNGPLTRQISEAVRIELRGGNTLNSKTEYSRCRIPRLIIDQEAWQGMKKKEKEIQEEEIKRMEEDLQPFGMKELEEVLCPIVIDVKRKIDPLEKSKSLKRRKLEVLEEWGENPIEEDRLEIKSWLTSSKQEEENSWPTIEEIATPPSKKMKQLELNFSKILEVEEAQDENKPPVSTQRLEEQSKPDDSPISLTPKYVRKTGKITKKDAKLLASKNTSMLSWVGKKIVRVSEGDHSTQLDEDTEGMDWQETEIDVMGEMDRKARLALANSKKMKIINKKWIDEIVGNLVESIIPTSVAGQIIEDIITESVWSGSVNIMVEELEGNKGLKEAVLGKLEENSILLASLANGENKARRLEIQKKAREGWMHRRVLGKLCDNISKMKIGEEDEIDRLRDVDIVMTEMKDMIDMEYEMETDEAHNEIDEIIRNMDEWNKEYDMNEDGILVGAEDSLNLIKIIDGVNEEIIVSKVSDDNIEIVATEDIIDIDMKYEDWMEAELSEMGYTNLSRDKIVKMLGVNTCNNVGYESGGTWLVNNWLNIVSTVQRGGGENNVYRVYDMCNNKLGCACETYMLKQGRSRQIPDLVRGGFSCVEGVVRKKKERCQA